MTCKHTRRLLGRHLDDRLGDAERRELDEHLAGCADCRAERARYEVPSLALRAAGPAPVPEDLAERSWRAAIAARHRTGARGASFEERFVWAAQRAAAAGALAAALVWGGLLLGDSDAGGSIDVVAAPDATEMAMTVWAADPVGAPEGFEP
jgi:anti-sigma factor RsiW